MAPDIAASRAVLEPLPDGARVNLAETSLFPRGGAELDDAGRYILASVVQGLLAPRILRIAVSGSPTASLGAQEAQSRAVAKFFEDFGITVAVQPPIALQGPPPGPASAGPQGLTISIAVVSS